MTEPNDPNVTRLSHDHQLRAEVERAWDLVAAREKPESLPPPRVELYSPERNREIVRSVIASGLLLLIALLSSGAVALYYAGRSLDDIAKLYGLVVTPLITLTSGIVGFYFGAESRRHD